jgi:hypothetical protein
VQHAPEQLTVGGAVENMHSELWFRRGKPPGLDDLCDQVGAHLHRELQHLLLCPRVGEVIHEGDAEIRRF